LLNVWNVLSVCEKNVLFFFFYHQSYLQVQEGLRGYHLVWNHRSFLRHLCGCVWHHP
jgi:hypothetical protein